MDYHLQNDQLRVEVSPRGAELQSIQSKPDGLEYLWQGDAEHWGRRSPILFPVVGRLKNQEYQYRNKTYTLGQHGFARDKTFVCTEENNRQLSFQLQADTESLQGYPFSFVLTVKYLLKGRNLEVHYQVDNPSHEKPLYFSIGGHPAFRCPLFADEKRSDYFLEMGKEEQVERQMILEGIRTGETRPVWQNSRRLRITDALFEEDALIFSGLRSEHLTLTSGHGRGVHMDFSGFPYLGIWSKSAASPFVCLEPWYGIADHQDHQGELTQKEGIIRLPAEESWKAHYRLTFL
jgi:galactose mutarotase-like enzyme